MMLARLAFATRPSISVRSQRRRRAAGSRRARTNSSLSDDYPSIRKTRSPGPQRHSGLSIGRRRVADIGDRNLAEVRRRRKAQRIMVSSPSPSGATRTVGAMVSKKTPGNGDKLPVRSRQTLKSWRKASWLRVMEYRLRTVSS
jgi:hypothetical protein